MVGSKPEHWRILTPIFGALAFTASVISAFVGYSVNRTVDEFDKHLAIIDTKFDEQSHNNIDFEHRITLIQGQCCKRSLSQVDEGG